MPVDVTPMRIGADSVIADEVFEVVSPYDRHKVGEVPLGGAAHLDTAVAAARRTLERAEFPAWRRAEVLDVAARLLAERAEGFAATIAQESAKPIRIARGEVARAVDTFRFSAGVARSLTGETVPLDASRAGEGKLGVLLRVPVGVVGAITPFNFPLNLVAHKVGPAIAAGCPMVLKPASATPLSALRLADLLIDECGLPPGWLNVVTCRGHVASRLAAHDDIAMITFTGSAEVGWALRAAAPRKKVSLELGNATPVIVEADSDWAQAARRIAVSACLFAGQSCISVQRVLVQRDVVEGFTGSLIEAVESLVVGDPMDEATDVSALITADEAARVASWIDEAVSGGAEVRCGGTRTGDAVVDPTVLYGVEHGMRVFDSEVFGPVAGIRAYDDFDDAIQMANDTGYGLQAGVFTRDIDKALRAARKLDFGGVMINEVPSWRADQMPYGGTKGSGNTKEGPAYTAREMTEERLVVLDL